MSNDNGVVRNFDKYISTILSGCDVYDFTKKRSCVNQHVSYMLNRTRSMFEWKGLPDTIPVRSLELYLQMNGNSCIAKHNGKLYAFVGGMGGEPDEYYMPTIYTVANPALKLSRNYNIGVDCVVIPNDTLYLGLLPLYTRYATAMTENEISINIGMINSRLTSLITAPDDITKTSAELFLEKLKAGELSIIGENGFFDGIRVQPTGTSGKNETLSNLIEVEQYLKASWYNEIGLNANYNMKRESLNSSESQMNNDALLPLVDDMLNCRKTAVEKINSMFGTEISVDLYSSWKDNVEEIKLEHNSLSGQPETKEGEPGGTETVE